MKSPRLKRKRKIDLPYWPSQEFIDKASAQLREKGIDATDSVLADMVKKGYWAREQKY